MYLQGKNISEISKDLNIKKGTVNYWLRKWGITRPKGVKSHCDEHYFNKIDTPSKAYFLGLLYADGGFIKKKYKNGNYGLTLSLELKKEDSYILEEFKKELKSSLSVKEIKREEVMEVNNKVYKFIKDNKYFRIGSKILISDLIKYGCIENKTFDLKNLPSLEKNLMRYFILGFYDGDGIASKGKETYMGFCGTYDLMKNISEYLYNEIKDISFKNPNFNKSNGIYYITYNKKIEISALFNYFYKDLKIPHLYRKEIKIDKYLNANTEIT